MARGAWLGRRGALDRPAPSRQPFLRAGVFPHRLLISPAVAARSLITTKTKLIQCLSRSRSLAWPASPVDAGAADMLRAPYHPEETKRPYDWIWLCVCPPPASSSRTHGSAPQVAAVVTAMPRPSRSSQTRCLARTRRHITISFRCHILSPRPAPACYFARLLPPAASLLPRP